MVETILAKPPHLVPPDCEDQTPQELNNTIGTQGEFPIELCIEKILQSCEGGSDGRGTPDSSASPQDPFTEVATTISGIQGIDYTSVVPKSITQSFTNTGSLQLIPDNIATAGNVDFEPIQGENEVDLQIICDFFRMEEQGKLDPSKSQAITNKTQVDGSSFPEIIPTHGRWKQDEHDRFLQGVEQYGRQWKVISSIVGTRTPVQVRTHAQKHFLNDPELEERSKKCPEVRSVKRQRDGKCEEITHFLNNGHWSENEHNLFLRGMQEHGRNWSKIADMVQSRTVLQIRSHAQKYFQKIEKYGSSIPEIPSTHGRWKQDEHDRFVQGVEQYGRQWKAISLIVGTRTPVQVRTHAQKHFLSDPELEERSKKRPELKAAKRQRVDRCGDISHVPNNGHWSENEHNLFLRGMQEHGRNWSKIADMVQSRTALQIRSHAQKHFQKIEKS